jgi:hypothetical protein
MSGCRMRRVARLAVPTHERYIDPGDEYGVRDPNVTKHERASLIPVTPRKRGAISLSRGHAKRIDV